MATEVDELPALLPAGAKLRALLRALDTSSMAHEAILDLALDDLRSVVTADLYSFKQVRLNTEENGDHRISGESYTRWCNS